ncbi:hypothetical protein AKJ44_01900 [candidate division MSBL1 archaeon SCGC-AAA261F17]|uniref:Uncharacterized protein n=1 Tax=candidate division MSBL1 archaeon SCGC-AAA261F17 TaxID=1698274 RepID=A0A133V647_9EURY|nr:hypothetical protein AKJ44_01900 [candidate division MSBL1 archaeon SCGC-AAA261F17]
MVSGLKDVTKEELEELYWGQNLTLSQIGDMFSVTYPTVIYWMEKRGVRRKGVRKYKTKVFNGDELEKAYLMGLRLGGSKCSAVSKTDPGQNFNQPS